MNLKLIYDKGKHSKEVESFFDFDRLDAFYLEEIQTAFYGDNWYSVLICDNKDAFFHVFKPSYINSSQFLDVDPFIGYYGPIVTTNNTKFLDYALNLYSKFMDQIGVVAEVIRFNPILNNQQCFSYSERLKVEEAKSIVICKCLEDDNDQLMEFTPKCRSSVKRGMRDCTFRILDKMTEWKSFTSLYKASLQRIEANKKWYYSDEFFYQAQKSDLFKVFGVFHQDKLISVTLLIDHKFAGYYFIAANSEQPLQGANEYLVYMLTRYLNSKNVPYLLLGGGNTSSDEDPLMKFKRKFAKETNPFYIGKIVHNYDVFGELCFRAIEQNPDLTESSFFLKYRL